MKIYTFVVGCVVGIFIRNAFMSAWIHNTNDLGGWVFSSIVGAVVAFIPWSEIFEL